MKKKRLFSAVLGLGLTAVLIGGCTRSVDYEPLAQAENDAVTTEPSAQDKANPSAEIEIDKNATEIRYAETYEAALETARSEGKPLMIDFYTDWCGVCKMMDKEVLNQKPIVLESQKFVNVKVNAEQREDLARAFGVRGYPTFIWLDNNFNIIERMDHGAPAGEFLARMQAAHSKFSPVVQL